MSKGVLIGNLKIDTNIYCNIILYLFVNIEWKLYGKYLLKHFWKENTFWTDGYSICSIGNMGLPISRQPRIDECPNEFTKSI